MRGQAGVRGNRTDMVQPKWAPTRMGECTLCGKGGKFETKELTKMIQAQPPFQRNDLVDCSCMRPADKENGPVRQL